MERKNYISPVQKNVLIQFLKEHENLQTGKFTVDFTFKKAQSLWEDVAANLNSIPNGAKKDWRQWRKTWQDLKKHTKSKAVSVKKHMTGTGGGEPSKPLSETDTQILEIMSPTQVDGLNIKEPPVIFSFNEENKDRDETDIVTDLDGVEVIVVNSAGNELSSENRYGDHEYASGLNETIKTPKKMNKTTRLTKSLDISNHLLTSVNKRNSLLDEYYSEKMKYYAAKISYFNEKLELDKKSLTVLNDVKNILNILVKK